MAKTSISQKIVNQTNFVKAQLQDLLDKLNNVNDIETISEQLEKLEGFIEDYEEFRKNVNGVFGE